MHSLLVEHLNDEYHLQSAPPPLVTDWELSTAFDSLNHNAAAGIDGLSAAILKSCFPVIKFHLLFIINSCFQLSYFPDAWRSSKVLIIGKPNKPSYDSLNSLRPISLINNFAKILEKIILGRLQWFAKNENWFSSNQHGFTDGRPTESACHSLTSFIHEGFQSKQVTACAFLDIKSAFDSAWHPAILAALSKRKCPPYLVCLVRCFLADRTALLSHNDFDLSVKVSLGCHQGGACCLPSFGMCSLMTSYAYAFHSYFILLHMRTI